MNDLLEFLNAKLADAERALRTREQMAESFEQSADAKFWEEMSRMPGVVVTKTHKGAKAPTAKQNKESAAAQRRIAIMFRRDVDMFRLAIAAIEGQQKS